MAPTLPVGLAPAIEAVGWAVDDFEYLDETGAGRCFGP